MPEPCKHPVAKGIDLVVVGFTGELKMLQLQARSLRLFAPDVFSQIHYLVNDTDLSAFQRFYDIHIVPELGPLAACARIVDGGEVAGAMLQRTDWRSQQSLKLLAANHVNSSSYLILDSKNHLIRPVGLQTLYADDGRLRTHRYGFNESFREKFENACRYFGVADLDPGFEALPTVTPFLMSTGVARDLVRDVEAREQQDFHQFFTGTKDFTEFYFYLAYMLSKPGLLQATYAKRSRSHVTLFRSVADDPERASDFVSVLEEENVYCFGVHRAVLAAANQKILAVICETWRRFGLVDDEEEARYFLTPDDGTKARARKRRFWLF